MASSRARGNATGDRLIATPGHARVAEKPSRANTGSRDGAPYSALLSAARTETGRRAWRLSGARDKKPKGKNEKV